MAAIPGVDPMLKAGHNHKSNWGQYVYDCPKCIEKWPDGPPPRPHKRHRAPTVLLNEKVAAMKDELREQMKTELRAELATGMTLEQVTGPAPKAPEPAPLPAVPAGTFLTAEQLAEAMRVLGTELRRPDPEVEEAKAAAKIRKARAREDEIKVIMEQKAMRDAEQNACNHQMSNGVSRIRGQVHNDGYLHEFCTWCLKPFAPRIVSQQERAARGMN